MPVGTAAVRPLARPARGDEVAAPPRLWVRAFRALDEAGLPYYQLRGSGPGPETSRCQEIDLLVDRGDLERLAGILSRLGFVKLKTWGHGGHRFYVAYEEDAGAWLKFDVVTRLRYGGPHRPLFSRALAGSLERRRRVAETFVPDAVDALLGLVLHALLDKRAFHEKHRRELERLREEIEAAPALQAAAAERFDRALGPTLRWSEAAAAIAGRNWEQLLSRRRTIAGVLFRRAPFGSVRHWLGGQIARLARPLLVPFGRRGFFVALLGPDGAGKSTLARALADDPQIRARIVYMGSNPGAGLASTRWIERWRGDRLAGHGRGGGALIRGITYGNRLFEQAWRSLVAVAWGLRGRLVVFDRHPHEALIADPAHGRGAQLRRRLLRGFCARPDLILLLDAPPEQLRSRKSEHTLERLARQRDRYRSLSLAFRGLVVIDASVPQEESVRRVTSAVWSGYRRRLEGTS